MIRLTETWVPTQAEFDAFASVSGDDNPIHVDPDFASRSSFGRTVSHGMLIYTKLWGLLRRNAPGLRQVSQHTMFPNPTFAGEPVRLEIVETEPNLLSLRAVRISDETEVFLAKTRVER